MSDTVRGLLTLGELRSLVASGEIDTVIAAMVDMQGRLMGKRVTGRFFLDQVAESGAHACSYLLGVDVEMEPLPGYRLTSWDSGYHDLHMRPDFDTLRRIPWLERTALVLCDLAHDDGAPVEESPRQILRRQVERARERGYAAMVASELEFYIFRESYASAQRKHFNDLEPYGRYIEDYHIQQGTNEEWLVRQIRNGLDAAGVPVEFSKGEWGPGQHELNLRYAAPVEMADRHTVFKHGTKEIAALNDVAITFMAKWRADLAGSSCHLHTSLWDRDEHRNLFWEEGAQPLGMSPLFRHFLGGLLAGARELAYFFAPYINSYKRYMAGTFAPVAAVWSHDNRTCGFRVVGHGDGLRVENRIPGADANPYLMFAATLAAGLWGIERRLEPPEMFEGDAYRAPDLPRIPRTLRDATAALERSEMAREAFGDRAVDHYLHTAHLEQEAYDRAVTTWELARNFERT
ncbi:MAG TPA: glutamine synthetase family protein [bacterium]|nr:glutamine synthetase family protein [bacterium]